MKLAALVAALLGVLLLGSGPGGPALAQSGGSIAGWVYYDLNENGQHEPNEPGVDWWYLDLFKVIRPDFSEPVDMVQTDWDGSYRFPNVEPGEYFVSIAPSDPAEGEPQPLPGSDVSVRVTLEAGQSVEEVNFRIAIPEATPAPASGGTIGGRVFFDADSDGALDEDERPLVGVSVALFNREASVEGLFQDIWLETGADGRYWFSGLSAGTYRVNLDMMSTPQGVWVTTSPEEREVVLADGETVVDVDFAVRRLEGTGVIAGTVFEDNNRNGVRDPGEASIAEPPLIWLRGVGFLFRDPADVSTGGRYQFTDLPAGSYEVVFGTARIPGPYTLTTGWVRPITLAEGETLEVDFGYARLQPAGISGRVVSDLDGDGQLEDGEPGLAGWGLCLTPGSSDVINCGRTRTDGAGVYTLENLWPGEYNLRPDPSESGEEQGQLSDWVVTVPDRGWWTVTLEEGQQVTGVDFGIHTRSSSGLGPSSPPVSGRGISPIVSSSGSPIESWQIAVVAIGSAATLGGVLGAVLIARRRRARSG